MRPITTKTVGTLLCTAGCFGLAFAPMLRFPLADRLVVVPVDQYTRTTLVGSGARYLDAARMRMVENADVVATSTLRGAPASSNDDTAVWDYFTAVEDTATGTDLDIRLWRMAIDRTSGHLRNCCGAAVGNDPTVPQSGLGMIWPLGDVDRRDYPVFDPTTRRTWTARFTGTRRVEGITAYTFVQRIEPTPVGRFRQLPGELLGLDEDRSYDADRVYQATVTTWVDPRSGVPVDRHQHVISTLRTTDGTDRLTVADLTLRMDPASRRRAAAISRDTAAKITLVRTTGPLVSAVLGLVLLGGGLAVSRRPLRRRGQHHLDPASRPIAHDPLAASAPPGAPATVEPRDRTP
ncbi:MAG TPA: DUF3068 domain-containing protein [Thermomonospora sp.]|nr:DUF3068 domain-containing protein [Thermomonospora sp.]